MDRFFDPRQLDNNNNNARLILFRQESNCVTTGSGFLRSRRSLPVCDDANASILSSVHPVLAAVCEVHNSMGKAVQMFCSGDWDHKRVPQGTENLDWLLDAAPSHLPTRPPRCFTGESSYLSSCCLPWLDHPWCQHS